MVSRVKPSKDESTPTAKQQLKLSNERREALTIVFDGEGANLEALVSGSRTGFGYFARRSSCHGLGTFSVTGFTDWRLIVGLRVREESFTEEKSRFPYDVVRWIISVY
ncbi:hypothetical protein HID58_050458 [Brassica napus]|uniref:Uncharacterized protein n=1 Tax=Brassica napus TaxID=3708 RepID=A0ABQ8A669_BRANA|nr:hypothetical protein HID58_050458 [Brassica napus]